MADESSLAVPDSGDGRPERGDDGGLATARTAVSRYRERRLICAIDLVVDLVAAAWDELVECTPSVLKEVGATPDNTNSGLDMGLQASWIVAHHYLGRPGSSPIRVALYQAATDRRWALTVKTLPPGTVVTVDALLDGAEQTGTVEQQVLVLGLLARSRQERPTGPPVGPIARAIVELADVCLAIEGEASREDRAAIGTLRTKLTGVLERHGQSYYEPSVAVPRGWGPEMTEVLERRSAHPLAPQWEDFTAALLSGGHMVEGEECEPAARVMLGFFLDLIGTVEPSAQNSATASVLAQPPTCVPRHIVWTPRLLVQLAQGLSLRDYEAWLRRVARAERRRPVTWAGRVEWICDAAQVLAGELYWHLDASALVDAKVVQLQLVHADVLRWLPKQASGLPFLTEDERFERRTSLREATQQVFPLARSTTRTTLPPLPDNASEEAHMPVGGATQMSPQRHPNMEPAGQPSLDQVNRLDRPIPLWRGTPLIHSGTISQLLAKFQLADSAACLVTLTPPTSVVVLRTRLPRGLGVQPDGDGANSKTVLLYPYVGEAPDPKALRVPYRLVDMLSMLSSDRCLSPDLHQALDAQLQQGHLPLDRGLQEHLVARARWRRTVPTVKGELEGLLSQTSLAARSELVKSLVQVTGEDPRIGKRLPYLLAAFRLPVLFEGWVKEIIPSVTTAPAMRPPEAQPSAPSAYVPGLPPRAKEEFDMERIAATRASTILARQKLLDLGEDVEDEDQSEDERSQQQATADGEPLPGAVAELARLLGTRDRHALSDIREAATLLGLVPLEAIRKINAWAEGLSSSADSLPDVLVEVDEAFDTVWVEPLLKELLR